MAQASNLETFLVAVIDASLFAQNLALALEALGYGICFIGGLRNRLPEVDRLLELPSGVLPLFGLCAGVPMPGRDPGRPPSTRPRLAARAVLARGRYWSDDELRGHLEQMDAAAAEHYDARGLPGRNWTGGVWRTLREPRREHLAGFYHAKGARLE